MKSTIIDLLTRDEVLTVKKLKKTLKEKSESIGEVQDDDIDQAIEKLVKRGKLVLDGKILKLVKKRKDIDEKNCIEPEEVNEKKRCIESNKSQESNTSKSLKGMYPELWNTGEQMWRNNSFDQQYLLTNPDGITRIFCGNLNKNVTEDQLRGFIDNIVYIKWITDRETQQFYGSTFLELKDPQCTITAVMKDKQKFLGRPLKIYYCPPRPNDSWPPKTDGVTSIQPRKPQTSNQLSEKPANCTKLYCGNLSYNIDDDAIIEFFKDCGTLVGLRWLTHKDSGEFRGCGFVQFETTEQADAAIKLNGKELLGRPIKLDWTT